MSENKRNRRSNQYKDPKRPIILVKKDDKDGPSLENTSKATLQDKPKILLKPKEKEIFVPSTAATVSSTQISIASRPLTSDVNVSEQQSKYLSNKASQSSSTSLPKDSKELQQPSAASHHHQTAIDQPNVVTIPSMKKPMPIISDHYQIQSHAFDYLIDTNTDFFVIGIVGTQGSGKSTILNLLIDDPAAELNQSDWEANNLNEILGGRAGFFETRSSAKEYAFSNMPATEGIQMYVTRDRTILLDCSPVLCNPYKKDCILNELDDLKMLIFLLSVCHLLVVVDDNGFNMHLMRLIQTADKMKVDFFDSRDSGAASYSPNVLIFKNKCVNRDFLPVSKQRVSNLYRAFFRDSKLKIFTGNRTANVSNGLSAKKKTSPSANILNVFYFPLIDGKKNDLYTGHPDIKFLMAEFRQRVFMSPRTSFSMPNQQQSAITEKNWSHLALGIWDSHKNNYFLQKYETFKEKEWTTRL